VHPAVPYGRTYAAQHDAGTPSTDTGSQQQPAPPSDAASELERLQQLLLQYEQAYERGSPEVS
jgi:hypothetical protein